MASVREWLSLVRPEFPLMTLLGVASGAAVAAERLDPAFALAAVGPVLITAGSFALNDFFDVASDKKLKRFDRPIAAGKVKPVRALALSVAVMLAGLWLGYYFSGELAFYIAAAYAVLSVVYSAALKKTLFIGNVVVSTTYAIPFVYGNVVVSGSIYALNPFVVVFAAIAFLAGLARELFNSVKDEKGDRLLGAVSLPMITGPKIVLAFASLLLVTAVALSVRPLLLLDYFYAPYAVLVGACDALLLSSCYSALRDYSYENLVRVRKHTIYALLLGLVGFASLAFA